MGKDLSDDQVSAMKEAFTLFDTDRDGLIAPSELGILIRSLGGNPTQAQLKSIMAQENLKDPFDYTRFLDLMGKHMKVEPFDRQLRDAFKVLDKESTGLVSVTELRHILTSIGEKLESSEFDDWIKEANVVSDGKIRYEDFIAKMVAKCLRRSPLRSRSSISNGRGLSSYSYQCGTRCCRTLGSVIQMKNDVKTLKQVSYPILWHV
ncbi:putative calcium-binding protein CML13, partial [Mucuna pruriens]